MDERDHVLPHDIKQSLEDVLRHRLILTYHAEAEGVKREEIIEEIALKIKVP